MGEASNGLEPAAPYVTRDQQLNLKKHAKGKRGKAKGRKKLGAKKTKRKGTGKIRKGKSRSRGLNTIRAHQSPSPKKRKVDHTADGDAVDVAEDPSETKPKTTRQSRSSNAAKPAPTSKAKAKAKAKASAKRKPAPHAAGSSAGSTSTGKAKAPKAKAQPKARGRPKGKGKDMGQGFVDEQMANPQFNYDQVREMEDLALRFDHDADVKSDQFKAAFRYELPEVESYRFNIYWSRSSVGLTCLKSGKDVANFSFGSSSASDVYKIVVALYCASATATHLIQHVQTKG